MAPTGSLSLCHKEARGTLRGKGRDDRLIAKVGQRSHQQQGALNKVKEATMLPSTTGCNKTGRSTRGRKISNGRGISIRPLTSGSLSPGHTKTMGSPEGGLGKAEMNPYKTKAKTKGKA